jgi:hypothetical protein
MIDQDLMQAVLEGSFSPEAITNVPIGPSVTPPSKADQTLKLVQDFITRYRVREPSQIWKDDLIYAESAELLEKLVDVAGVYEDDVEWIE